MVSENSTGTGSRDYWQETCVPRPEEEVMERAAVSQPALRSAIAPPSSAGHQTCPGPVWEGMGA